jgi:hypothetical protein
MNSKIMYLISALIGICYWTIMTKITGKIEAWDSAAYFTTGLLIFIFFNFTLGFISPEKAWRWGLVSTLSQLIAMLFINNEIGPLLIVGLITFAILSIPNMLSAHLGSIARKMLLNKRH